MRSLAAALRRRAALLQDLEAGRLSAADFTAGEEPAAATRHRNSRSASSVYQVLTAILRLNRRRLSQLIHFSAFLNGFSRSTRFSLLIILHFRFIVICVKGHRSDLEEIHSRLFYGIVVILLALIHNDKSSNILTQAAWHVVMRCGSSLPLQD